MERVCSFDNPVIIVGVDKEMLHSIYMTLLTKGFKKIYRCAGIGEFDSLSEKNDAVVFFDTHQLEIEEQLQVAGEIIKKSKNNLIVAAIDSEGAEIIDMLQSAGVYDYIVKPIDETRLVTSIVNAGLLIKCRRENNFLRSCSA